MIVGKLGTTHGMIISSSPWLSDSDNGKPKKKEKNKQTSKPKKSGIQTMVEELSGFSAQFLELFIFGYRLRNT